MAAVLDRAHLKIAAFLFLSLNFLYLLASSGRVRTMDEVTLAFEVESVAVRATTAIPEAVNQKLFYGKYDRFGRPQGPYGLGNVILVLPWYWLGKVASHIAPGIPANRTTLFTDTFTVASSAAFSALAATFAFLILVRTGVSARTALAAALMLALATPLFSYSSWFYSEPLASALLLGAAFFLITGDPTLSIKNTSLAALFLGVLLWVRATHVIAIPIFLLAGLLRGPKRDWRGVLTVAAIVGAFGLAYLARNQYLFGNPLDFGYPEVGEGGKRLNSFDTPLLTGLFGFLLSPGKSVILFAPPTLLALAGISKLAKRNLGLAVACAGTPLAYLFFFAGYTQWEGGYSIGPRYLMPAIALLCLGLGPVLANASPRTRKLAMILFLCGIFVQIVSISISFMEDQATGSYYDQNWNYRMNYSSISRQTRLLLHYIGSSQPAPLGLGYDRWFVFLAKAGVSRGTIAFGLAFELAGLLFFAWALKQSVSAVTHLAPPVTPLDENVSTSAAAR